MILSVKKGILRKKAFHIISHCGIAYLMYYYGQCQCLEDLILSRTCIMMVVQSVRMRLKLKSGTCALILFFELAMKSEITIKYLII